MIDKLFRKLVRDPIRRFFRGQSSAGRYFEYLVEFSLIPILWILAGRSRKKRNACPIDVGIGPEPIISHKYYKEAFQRQGYRVETFVQNTYFITNEFDINLHDSKKIPFVSSYLDFLFKAVRLFRHILKNYKCVMIHFNGGPLFPTRFLSRIEAQLLKRANVASIVTPYGSDIQNLRFATNLQYKHAAVTDYPGLKNYYDRVARNLPTWIKYGSYTISGCDWVDYMHHWDKLMLTDWCIDVAKFAPSAETLIPANLTGPFCILHAPNHTAIKGTDFLHKAIHQLKEEGLDIELVLLQGVPNDKILETIQNVDLVADQFVIGWYGFFAVEAMAAQKPVMTYLKKEYVDLHIFAGNVEAGEIPIINTRYDEIVDNLRWAYHHRDELQVLGQRSREFVQKYHSLEYIGEQYDQILRSLKIEPRQLKTRSQALTLSPLALPEAEADKTLELV